MMLADLGAEVIKVEHPQGGDPFRAFRGGQYSPNFVAYNRGKRSIQLDLRADAGRSILLKLVARADVLLENYRPGIMEKLGLGDDVLTAANARHHGPADLLGRDHAAAGSENSHPSPRRDDPVLRCAPRHRLGDARQPHLG